MIRIRRGAYTRFKHHPQPRHGYRCMTVVRTEPCCLEKPGCKGHPDYCREPITRVRYVLAGACAEHQGSES